jgi:hypothetical protein
MAAVTIPIAKRAVLGSADRWHRAVFTAVFGVECGEDRRGLRHDRRERPTGGKVSQLRS